MKYLCLTVVAAVVLLCATGCGRGGDGDGTGFPKGFAARSDVAQVAYVMEHASPDSVARFICEAALGNVPGASIDTLATATLYAFETYQGENLNTFADEYETYTSSLALPKKMRILAMAGQVDPQNLGYQLGLEYVGQIREQGLTVAEVDSQLEEFRRACASDTDTYRRFRIGFRTALEADHGVDLPQEIYHKYTRRQP